MDLIVFHKSCPDGFCASYIAHQKYPEAQLLARDHGLEPPYEEVKDKDVLVLDFSWRTRGQNIQLAQSARSFRILDHHKTAQATLAGLDFATFDMERSGAGLAWDYLFGKDSADSENDFQPRPWFVDYVEDRDLWRKQLPKTDEVNAFIMALPMTFHDWGILEDLDANEAAQLGEGALAQIKHYVREGRLQAQNGVLGGPWESADGEWATSKFYMVKIVNALYMNISELAGALAEEPGTDIGIGYFERGDGRMQFSLRSRKDVDVSAVATHFGGGGHKNAAGFQVSVTEGRALVDAILNRNFNDSVESA